VSEQLVHSVGKKQVQMRELPEDTPRKLAAETGSSQLDFLGYLETVLSKELASFFAAENRPVHDRILLLELDKIVRLMIRNRHKDFAIWPYQSPRDVHCTSRVRETKQ